MKSRKYKFFLCVFFIMSCNFSENLVEMHKKNLVTSDSLLKIGVCFLEEDTDKPNYDSAILFLEKASILGNFMANRILAEQFFFGYKFKVDTSKANKYVRKAIEQGDNSIYFTLAKWKYYNGYIDSAIHCLKKGDRKYCCFELANILLLGYAFGQPIPVYQDKINVMNGIEYLKISAENNNLEAQLNLVYYNIKGIEHFLPVNIDQARYYYNKAKNNPESNEIPGALDEIEELSKLL